MTEPIEVTTKYVTTVHTLQEAWAFVMDRLQLVGPDPHVIIKPIWRQPVGVAQLIEQGDEGLEWTRVFEVVVSGMTKEEGHD